MAEPEANIKCIVQGIEAYFRTFEFVSTLEQYRRQGVATALCTRALK